MKQKFHYVRRIDEDGRDRGVVDMPAEHVAEAIKTHPTWIDLGEASVNKDWEKPATVKIGVTECPLCGFKAKNKSSLDKHKTEAHYS